MEMSSLLNVMERVLDSSHAAVFTTVDGDGRPHSRWMVPAVIRGQAGSLYAVTSPHFAKIEQIATHDRVSWLIQSKALDEILEVTGKAIIIDNPALKSDVLEALGPNLSTFWHINPDESDLTVIETAIESITYLQPKKGERATATV
jgi:general stress protein 26